jgi:hypothetical protein
LPRALFVYYRVAEADAAAAADAVKQCQAGLRLALPGLHCQLWRRPEAPTGEVTLMETYAAPDGIDEALAQRIEAQAAQALSPWLRGTRHTEVFVPL